SFFSERFHVAPLNQYQSVMGHAQQILAHQVDPLALPAGKLRGGKPQPAVGFLTGVQQRFEFMHLCWPQKWRYVVNGSLGISSDKVEGGVTGKYQQRTDQKNRDDIEHHRPSMSFTALVYRLT